VKTSRSSSNIRLTQDGPQNYRFTDIDVILENPLEFITSVAVLEIKYFFNYSTDSLQRYLFTLQDFNWTSADEQSVTVSFDRPNWSLNLNYKKDCELPDYFGFACGNICPKPATAQECYICDPVNGTKICCDNPDYDPNTCYRRGSNPPRKL
jgi:hypothetical protein